MGEVVIALYRPKAGKAGAVEKLVARHAPTLQRLKLATRRPAVVVRSRNGTILEIFEWASARAVKVAHEHPEVVRIWEAMAQVCDFAKLDSLPETRESFPHFKPVARPR